MAIRIPTAANVSAQPVAQDPGVRVPQGAFDSSLGIAAEELAKPLDEQAERFLAADRRIRVRQNALESIRLQNSFREERRELLEATRKTEDFSIPGVAEAYNQRGRDKLNELVASSGMDEESQLQLAASLESDFNEFSDKAAILSIEAGDARTQQFAGEILNSLEARAVKGELPSALIDEGMKHITPGSNLASAMRPGDEIIFARALNERVISGSIERFFQAGDVGSVEEMMDVPAVQRALGEQRQRDIFRRIERVKQELATGSKPIVVAPGASLVTPTGEELFKSDKAEKLVEVFDENSPTKSRFVPESEASGKPGRERGPVISITNQGETAMAKELGERDAERISKLEDNAQTAFRTLAEIDRMKAAIESGRFTTGVLSDARVFLSRLANFVGASKETLDLLGDAATSDTLDAATNRLGVEAAQKLGRVTNMSLTFIRDSLPNLSRTPEGNLILLEVMDRTSQREIQLASMAEDFLQRHGTLRPKEDKTYFQAIRDLEKEDPVITPELRQRIIDGSTVAPKSFREIFAEKTSDPEGPSSISTQEEYNALPSGQNFVWPDGNTYRKP